MFPSSFSRLDSSDPSPSPLPHRPLRPIDAIAPLSSPEHAQAFSISLKHNTSSYAPPHFCLNREHAIEPPLPIPPPSFNSPCTLHHSSINRARSFLSTSQTPPMPP